MVVWNLDQQDLDDPQQRSLFTGHTGPVCSATFSLDGKMIASAGSDHRALVWDRSEARPFPFEQLAGNEKVTQPKYLALNGHNAAVRQVRFSKTPRRQPRFVCSA